MSGRQITFLDQWPTAAFGVELPISRERIALGVIDMQHYCISPEGHLARTLHMQCPDIYEAYSRRVDDITGNIGRLLSVFRERQSHVFYTRHGSLLPEAEDMILRRRNRERVARVATEGEADHMPLQGTRGHEIIPALAPLPGELILDKNTSSTFHSTSIDLFLRNMEVDTLVLTGLASDMCVFTTALDAADRGFHVIIASDGCTTLDPGMSEATQLLFGRVFGYVMQTGDIIDWLTTGKDPERVCPEG